MSSAEPTQPILKDHVSLALWGHLAPPLQFSQDGRRKIRAAGARPKMRQVPGNPLVKRGTCGHPVRLVPHGVGLAHWLFPFSPPRDHLRPSNTAHKLRSGARVSPGQRGHEAACPFWPPCRRKLRQLHALVRWRKHLLLHGCTQPPRRSLPDRLGIRYARGPRCATPTSGR